MLLCLKMAFTDNQLGQFSFKIIGLYFASLFFTSSLWAADGQVYFAASAGVAFTQFNKTGHVITAFDGGLIDDYPLLNNQLSQAVLSLNGGYEFASSGKWPRVALGLGLYGMPSNRANYRGLVIETAEGDASSLLYDYAFRVQNSTRLMAEMQLSWASKHFDPYVSLGLGASRLRLESYHESAINCDGCFSAPPFQAHSTTNLAYQAGLGISHRFMRQAKLSLGYRYVDLGVGRLRARGVDYPGALNMQHLTSNEIYLAFTHYLANL